MEQTKPTPNRKKDAEQNRFINSFVKALKSLGTSLPVLIGVVLLMGFFKKFVSFEVLSSLFEGQIVQDSVIGAILGSILAGNPVNSYIIGGELLKANVSLFAVTSFLVTWVTVGIIQMPAEVAILGKRFALWRNSFSFVLAILVSIATVLTLGVIR